MTQRPQYDRQPLVEAIFELYVSDDQAQVAEVARDDAALERIAQNFPEYRFNEEHLKDFGIRVEAEPNGSVRRSSREPRERVRRWNEERTSAIQVGSHMCAHNILGRAYTGFENHLPTVSLLIESYLREAHPTTLAWIGQRYINSIKLPVEDQQVASYFEIYPKLPAVLAGHRPISVQIQTADIKYGQVFVNLFLQEKDAEFATYVLDIYARSHQNPPSETDVLLQWHKDAHQGVRDAFELSISKRSKTEIFKERQ